MISRITPNAITASPLAPSEMRIPPRLGETHHLHAAMATLKEFYVRFSRVRYGVKSPFGLELRMNQEVGRARRTRALPHRSGRGQMWGS